MALFMVRDTTTSTAFPEDFASDSTSSTVVVNYTQAGSYHEPIDPPDDVDVEFYQPFPIIEREWFAFKWWLFDHKPRKVAWPVLVNRRSFTRGRVRRHYALSAVLRVCRQRRMARG